MSDLLVLQRPAESLQNSAGFREKLEHTGPVEKERVASVLQSEQLAMMPEPPLPKGKGTEPSIHRKIVRWERVEVSESCTLLRKRKLRAGA